ncbi:MAG TPA: polysaccharide deacetylase family protein [Gemmatimonadales bacterium]|jgi:peptidoglycan/xylan/chitin deacetylase (PgdA/CDA1 family)
MLIASLPPGSLGIALTFDDGPDPVSTPRVLDALGVAKARATFFLIGERAARHPEIVKRIADEGHAIGHHSWTHSEPATTPASVLLRETAQTRRFLEDLTGAPAPLFRPPHGKLTAGKLLGVWRQGNAIVLWNEDPKDFRMATERELAAWAAGRQWRGGEIVLLHDVHAHTAAAMPAILAATSIPFVALGSPHAT